jgi:HK97 family phage major capsid protein
MLKSTEMKQELENLKNGAKVLIENKEAKIEDIQAKNTEIETLQAKISMQEKIELEEVAAIVNTDPTPAPKDDYTKEFINGLRTKFKNAMSVGVPADGGYTVPQDIQTTINELRQTKDALQNLITVEKVTAPTGSRVFKARAQQTGFAVVLEDGTITEKGTPQFTPLSYAVKKYAGFLKVTNELLKDSDTAISKVLGKWIGDESRVTRNKLILAVLGLKARTAIAGVDAIKGILNITLDPAFRYTASIVTNQDGFNYLDLLKDLDGNYLLQPSVTAPTGKQLFGVPVVMISNADLPTVATKAPMIIGDLKEAVVMFDKETLSVMASDVAGDAFLTDVTLFRAIEREDVKTRDAAAFVYGEVTV